MEMPVDRLQRRQFSVRTVLGVMTLCAVVFTIPHRPIFGTVLFFTYIATASSRLPVGEGILARGAHDAILGFAVGFLVPAAWLSVLVHAAPSSNERIANATVGLLAGPAVGIVCGVTLAILRSRG